MATYKVVAHWLDENGASQKTEVYKVEWSSLISGFTEVEAQESIDRLLRTGCHSATAIQLD